MKEGLFEVISINVVKKKNSKGNTLRGWREITIECKNTSKFVLDLYVKSLWSNGSTNIMKKENKKFIKELKCLKWVVFGKTWNSSANKKYQGFRTKIISYSCDDSLTDKYIIKAKGMVAQQSLDAEAYKKKDLSK